MAGKMASRAIFYTQLHVRPASQMLRSAGDEHLTMTRQALMTDTGMSEDHLRSFLEADEYEMSVVFSDPHTPDNPMIFVSEEFEHQTGYSPEEAVGRNCRFLQGPDTNPHAIEAIRQGLKAQTRFTIDILNYRKDGTPFVNRLRIRPIYDANGGLLFFAGAQNPV